MKFATYSKFHVFFKANEVVVVEFFCNPLHVIITQAVYLFVGKPERTKIHSADTQHFILLTPIEGIQYGAPFVLLRKNTTVTNLSRYDKTSSAMRAFSFYTSVESIASKRS